MKVPKRIAQVLINSLKGGVVPRIGLPYITVGRKEEIDALLKDVDMIEEGIIDPTKVTRSAVLNASSIAALFVTTEAAVSEIKEDKPAAPAMPEGMY